MRLEYLMSRARMFAAAAAILAMSVSAFGQTGQPLDVAAAVQAGTARAILSHSHGHLHPAPTHHTRRPSSTPRPTTHPAGRGYEHPAPKTKPQPQTSISK